VINVGIIGCGDVATHSYMPGLNELGDRARVVALFDIVQERVDKAKEFHPDAAGYTDYDEFLAHADPKMDLVLNLTPAPLHRDITARAFDAGYSVYTEKPIASDVQDAHDLVKMAEEKGLQFFSAPAMMVTARFQWLKGLLEEGKIGRPYFIKSHHAGMGPASWRTYSGDPAVFYTAKVGPLIDLGVYQLHAMTGLFGPAKRLQAMGGIMNTERVALQPSRFGTVIPVQAPDLYSINIEFEGNRFAHLFNSFAVPASNAPMFEVYGSMGAVSIGARQWYDGNGTTDIYTRDESKSGDGEGWEKDVPAGNPNRTKGILESGLLHALDVMEQGVDNTLSAAHATHVLELMVACGTAIETGESITIESTF
jgi:predicted dehydrogenase